MQEYNDGTFSEPKELSQLVKDLQENEGELERTKTIHFGSKEELEAIKLEKVEVSGVVKYYGETLLRVESKLDMIIKHFKIYPIIGEEATP